jgi:hypothetical protein
MEFKHEPGQTFGGRVGVRDILWGDREWINVFFKKFLSRGVGGRDWDTLSPTLPHLPKLMYDINE